MQTYKFQILQEELICNRIVWGIRDNTIREKLLQETKLTLSECVDICQATESAASCVEAMAGKGEVHMVNSKFRGQKRQNQILTNTIKVYVELNRKPKI